VLETLYSWTSAAVLLTTLHMNFLSIMWCSL